MPTIFRRGPYRFFFYTGDREEPPHVHVETEDRVAKFWLDPIRLARTGGMRRGEISEVLRILVRHRDRLMEAWHGYFRG